MTMAIDFPTTETASPEVTSFKHILDLLKHAASATQDKGLSYLDNGISEAPVHVSYNQLLEQATQNAARLVQAGIVSKGSITITYFDTHQENVLWFWSVTIAGGICAILNPISNEPKTAAGQLDNIKRLFGDAPVVTNHRLSALIASRQLNVKSIDQISKLAPSESSIKALESATTTSEDDIAVLLFTSGSTGHSKAVKFSHAQLIASVKAKAAHLGSYGKTFMSWVSFDHSANFCELHLQALYVGSDQVHVPTSDLALEPWRFYQLLSQYKVGYSFSPNFFLAAATTSLEQQGPADANFDFSNLKTIMCGGESNRVMTLKAADAVLRRYGAPQHCIKAAYGLSETCSACFYNLQSPEYDLAHNNTFASVGTHLPDCIELKIVGQKSETDDQDEGLVYLRGPLIFKGYYNNDEATNACMDDGWMNTGDIGKLDHHGNLLLIGRAKEVLILNGNNYSSFEIEYAIETANIAGLTISYTAIFSSWDEKQNSEGVVVLFNPTEAAIGPKNLKATLQLIEKTVFSVCAQKPKHIIPLPKALLPKSTIGKLSRAKLRQQYEQGTFDDYIIGHDTIKVTGKKKTLDDVSPLQKEIAEVYSTIVNIPAEDLLEKDALLSSGINSLGFMRLKKALENKLKIHQEISMPLLIRCHSIDELEHELVLIGTLPQTYDPIVSLVTTGSKQPLFLLHPGAGEFLCWIGLIKYLPDRPLYALRAKGLHPGEGTFNGLEDLLQCYYDAIRRTQPKGPYAFLGYCFGGLLSFELAKMFERAGEQVNFVGGIDNPPELRQTIGQVKYRSLMIDVLPVVTGLSEAEAREFGEETASLTDEEFYELLFSKFSPEFIEQMDITVPRLQAFGRVEDVMRVIADKYRPSGKTAVVDIFRADPMPHFGATPEEWRRDVLGQWKNFTDDARFHDVQGSHISLIKEPLIHDFQKIVNDALTARGI